MDFRQRAQYIGMFVHCTLTPVPPYPWILHEKIRTDQPPNACPLFEAWYGDEWALRLQAAKSWESSYT